MMLKDKPVVLKRARCCLIDTDNKIILFDRCYFLQLIPSRLNHYYKATTIIMIKNWQFWVCLCLFALKVCVCPYFCQGFINFMKFIFDFLQFIPQALFLLFHESNSLLFIWKAFQQLCPFLHLLLKLKTKIKEIALTKRDNIPKIRKSTSWFTLLWVQRWKLGLSAHRVTWCS